jgi:hypothetical protein
MSEVISEPDAAARKEQDVATIREQRFREGHEESVKMWVSLGVFESGFAVTVWLNAPPAQGAGEAMTTVLDDGRVVAFAFL